jgi:endoglucanase
LVDEFEVLRGDIAIARGFDNRIGTFAAIEALRLLKQGQKKIAAEVCAVSNVQEEVGLFGARQIAYSLKPDVAVCVDVTHATDVPGLSKEQHGDVQLGHGPAITRGGPNHPEVYARLRDVAKKAKIPLQLEAVSGTSGTDTDAIFWTRGGIPSALVSLPNRYMHSPVEMINLRDLKQVSELLAAFVTSVKPGEQFKTKV